ncbi:replication endonuclease [Shewanella algae]|uniref:replication endonuclease n=1 Tax=Shewanella algae TaxID=38313 RepID=UPI001C56BE24|nr:replication endonuclease [Shewanella algae]
MPEVHSHDNEWLNKQLYGVPEVFRQEIMADYAAKDSRREANLHVLAERKAIAAVMGKSERFYHINIQDRDCTQAAKIHSRHVLRLLANNPRLNLAALYALIAGYIQSQGIAPPQLAKRVLNAIALGHIAGDDAIKVKGAINRAKDEQWWRRKLKTKHIREGETLSRRYNQVNRAKGIYISNLGLGKIRHRWQENQSFLESTIATNELGFSASLAELSSLNVSNPSIRRQELMVRTRGFEECSKAMGHQALFITLTCPSKYHRSLSKAGMRNPNWNGATPLDGQQYLRRTFERIRAALGNQDIGIFGFRVAEPHHDGTPHWHLLLFVEPEQAQALLKVFRRYAFEEDGNEPGAAKHRLKVEEIDPSKGSATGYIAKYISKNIDGEGIDQDLYGKDAKDSAIRVRAWASLWGIRQFQQLGGASVTVWRELRRMEAIKAVELDWIESIRQCADQGDWQGYTEQMGGVFCKRQQQVIRPLYEQVQEAKQNPEAIPEIIPGNPEHSGINPESAPKTPPGTIPENSAPLAGMEVGIPGAGRDESGPRTASIAETSTETNRELTDIPAIKTNRYGDEVLTRIRGIVSFGVQIITRIHQWTISQRETHKEYQAESTDHFSLECCQ